MDAITLDLDSKLEVLDFIDQSVDNVFIDGFRPRKYSEWWKASLKLSPTRSLDDIEVRGMQFDIRTNIKGLRKILEIETNFLDIYQFTRPIANGLIIENLPKDNLEKILKENGLVHMIEFHFEYCFVRSHRREFLESIISNPKYINKILFKSF